MDDETKKLKNKNKETKEVDDVVAAESSFGSVNLHIDPTLIAMNDVRQLGTQQNAALNRDLFLTLKGKYPNLPDKDKDFHLAMMLYRLAVKSSSLQSDDDTTGMTYTREGVEVELSDKLWTDVVFNFKGIGNRTNALRVWGRTNDALYLAFCRQNRNLSYGGRPLDAGIPAGYHYLCADFLTGAGLTDLECAVYIQAKEQLLKKRGADEVIVTNVRQLGKFNTR
uniref:25 kDa coat protein n=1 Tax=Citrus tristeza virus TaxID=12162 RepID=B2CKL6_9CLOS|nr:25 kDa coat protein [Citrus tristeza virus]